MQHHYITMPTLICPTWAILDKTRAIRKKGIQPFLEDIQFKEAGTKSKQNHNIELDYAHKSSSHNKGEHKTQY